MSTARSILTPPFLAGVVLALAVLSNPPSLKAQNIPSNPQATSPQVACSVSATQFASWFETGTASLNGVVKPADSLNFINTPNCSFYQWAYQMFLWLTSPAPATYCGGGAHVFDSPAFFDVSPPDSGENRTLITHTCNVGPLTGVIRTLNVRAAPAGPHNLPVIMSKSRQLLEVETPLTGPTGKPLVFSSTGIPVEVHNIRVNAGKAVFLNKTGKPIALAKPILRKQILPTATNKIPVVQKFIIGGRPIFIDPFGNVVEVEQGQAESGGVLMAQTGSLVYYGISINDVYAYFVSGIKDHLIAPTAPSAFPSGPGQFGQFPTTPSDLAKITAFAAAHNVTFPDPNALAVEIKTAWVDASTLPNPSNYITMTATIPNYALSTTQCGLAPPPCKTPNGSKTVQLALVEMHVVGSTAGHPEMIWATFEHIGNTPLGAYQYNSTVQRDQTINQDTSGTWLFSKTGSTGPFNCMLMKESGGNIILPAASGSCPAGSFTASDTLREQPWGADPISSPNPIDGNQSNCPPTTTPHTTPRNATSCSNTEIISINNSVRGMIPAGDVRANYYTPGATWTAGGTPPNTGLQVGTSVLAGSALETYTQPSNCFGCHVNGDTPPGNPPLPNATTDVSHIFSALLPLSFAPLSVSVSAPTETAAQHRITVTVTNSGTGAPVAGAKVSVTDLNEGFVETTGTTSAAGTVTLSYPPCFEVITGGELPQNEGPLKPIIVHLPCDGTVEATGFPAVTFSAP